MEKVFLGRCSCQGFWLLDNINQDATSFVYSAQKHERRSGVESLETWSTSWRYHVGALRAPLQHRFARTARARPTHTGKGLVHFGRQDKSGPVFENDSAIRTALKSLLLIPATPRK